MNLKELCREADFVCSDGFVFNNDCLKVLDGMIKSDIKVDCIITDPPYNIARDNNFNTMGRSGIDFGEWDKGFDQCEWLNRIPKVLNKNGSAVIFNDWKNVGEIAKYLESLGMQIKDMLRWEKTNPMPRNRDRRYITDYECAIWVTMKNAKWTFNRLEETYQRPKFVYSIQGTKDKFHPTQKPLPLMEEIIKIHTNENDVVLDPFSGSGSTLIACKNLKRKFVGVELEVGYFNSIKERLGGN